MSKHSRELFREPLTELADGKQEFLIGKVSYNLGGPNYFSGGMMKRGYRFSVSTETIEQRDGYTMRGFTIGGPAAGVFLKDAARFNAKELERIAPTDEQVEELKTKVKGQWEANRGRGRE